MQRYANDEKGVALPMVILIAAVFSIIGLGCLGMATAEIRLARNYEEGVQALYLAEAALNETLEYLQSDISQRGVFPVAEVFYNPEAAEDRRIAVGRYMVRVNDVADNPYARKIIVIAQTGSVTKKIETTVTINTGLLTFRDYAIYGGNVLLNTEPDLAALLAGPGLYAFGVQGHIFSERDAYFGPFCRVTGTVNTGGEIVLDGLAGNAGQAYITDMAESNARVKLRDYVYQYPIPDRAEYERAAAARYYAADAAMVTKDGRKTLYLSQVGRNLSGIVYVEGDVIIDTSDSIRGDLTIFSVGNISVAPTVIAVFHKLGLVASRGDEPHKDMTGGNIDLGDFSICDAASSVVMIHAEGNVVGHRTGDFREDIFSWNNWNGINGTIIGRSVDLTNVRVNYDTGIKARGLPPLPPNMGVRTELETSDWNSFAVQGAPVL